MKKIVLIVVTAFTLIGCSKEQYFGSGEVASENRQVAYFNKVSSEGVFNVTITKGDKQKVEIVADNNILHRVRTDVTNGKLKLHLDDGNYKNIYLEARITVLDLKEITNSGAGDMHIENNYDEQIFKVSNTGSANIYLQGSCESLNIRNEGSGDIFAYNMTSDNCDLIIEGSSDIKVTCSTNLSVDIEGSGHVYYKGNPSVSAKISGSGEVIDDN